MFISTTDLINSIMDLINSIMDFLTRQGLEYTETEVDEFVANFLKDYLCWDNLKDDMYDSLFEKFE